MKKFLSVVLVIIMTLSIPCSIASANENELTIVFTHDLHSHFDPFMLDGESRGGLARIKTIIDNTKASNKNTVVLDAGDFSMGTLFQSSYTTAAIEYRMLGLLNYDATIFGNHEFDYGFDSVKDMINTAKASEENLPPILCANINAAESDINESELNELNIHKYKIIQTNDYTVAVFGVMGPDAVELSSASGLVFNDYIEASKSVISEIKGLYSPDFIICLSHGGTGSDVDDEDIKLAKAVDGIDVIISGHTHSTLNEAIKVNDTLIGSCGEYGENVGIITLSPSNKSNAKYSLVKIDSNIPEDEEVLTKIETFREDVNKYLEKFGYQSGDQVLAYSPYDFTEQMDFSSSLAEQPLGNLISDSYIHAIKQAEGDNYINVDVSVAPLGVIRSSIDKGNITVSQVYEISSLGIGFDGVSGYPLCSVYLTGEELWTLAEIDASVSAIMPYAQLYCSGLGYSINTNRMFLNRVYDCWLIDKDGNRVEIQKDKLYRVVSGLSSAQMLGTVKDKSFGLLQLTPKDSSGNAIYEFEDFIITDKNGAELKEWKALADYLSSFEKGNNGVPVIPATYSEKLGRKNVYYTFSFSQVFTNWSFISWVVFALIIALGGLVAVIIILIFKKYKHKKREQLILEIQSTTEE